MKKEKLPIHFAPLQGYTDAIYRQAHARIFGGIASYYTPFVRIEHGDFRRKDVRELEAENNRGVVLTPQLIASTPETILHILSLFIEKGYQEVDINLGCPFPTLAKRHNGAGLLPYPDEVKALLSAALEAHPDIRFSVKMRLGWEDAAECMALLPLLNSLPLSHITMHPRLGKQQYKGEVDLEAFQRFYAECEKPLVYNGDLLTLDDIERIESRFPRLAGLMIGRGLLANPALAIEYQQGEPLSPQAMMEKIRLLHADVFSQYGNLLEGGEQQLLTKMRTFWEYLLPDGDRKAKKVIHKTSKLSNYQAAVSNLLR
ncbi:MAG: tRNA-dihydrouridine synthase family protein [Mediterranea massiliensis]|nr:tRNA-dihydrouridine synthase family protein [Mediterranea massiliensis]